MPSKNLDPIIIAQLGNLHLRARRILDGLFSGHHINPLHGNSQEFSEHKPYHPGEDLKYLDWKVLGRTNRLVVRKYQDETNVGGWTLMDDSASMNFSHGGRPSKLEYAKTLAASIGYLMVAQHDSIGIIARDKSIPPGAHRGHLDQYFNALESVQGQGTWNLEKIISSPIFPIRKKSLIFVFSDLLGDQDSLVNSLRSLQSKKNEIIVFHILDPAECNLPFEGPMEFEDSETGDILKTEPETIRDNYKALVNRKIEGFSHVFRSSGIDYLFLKSNTPFDKGLGAYLSFRGNFI